MVMNFLSHYEEFIAYNHPDFKWMLCRKNTT